MATATAFTDFMFRAQKFKMAADVFTTTSGLSGLFGLDKLHATLIAMQDQMITSFSGKCIPSIREQICYPLICLCQQLPKKI